MSEWKGSVSTERYRIPVESVEEAVSFFQGLGMKVNRSGAAVHLKKERCSVSIYSNGIAILQCSGVMRKVSEDYLLSLPFSYRDYALRELGVKLPEKWTGTDEAGKGDYFGPLVVSAVCISEEDAEILYRRGLVDSKRLAPSVLEKYASMVRELIPPSHRETMIISPQRYNELHASMGNVNTILAWAHAKLISTLAAKTRVSMAIVDRFAAGATEETMRKATGLEVIMIEKGEREMGVAAAAVLSVSAFRSALFSLSEKHGIRLVPGAGEEAKSLYRQLRETKGAEMLRQVAKTDFTP
ncbi:MAG: hypothetical protein QXP70_04715 [Methanomassiliicoccales archaeon]